MGVQQESKHMKNRRFHEHNKVWKITSSYPRSSKNRQITLATISSFFSSGACGLALVRCANFSVEVAPRHSAKSIVDDYPSPNQLIN